MTGSKVNKFNGLTPDQEFKACTDPDSEVMAAMLGPAYIARHKQAIAAWNKVYSRDPIPVGNKSIINYVAATSKDIIDRLAAVS